MSTDQPIRLPLPPGQVIVFDHSAGETYVARAPRAVVATREASTVSLLRRNMLRPICRDLRRKEYAQTRQRGAGFLLAHVYSWAYSRPLDWPWCWLPTPPEIRRWWHGDTAKDRP